MSYAAVAAPPSSGRLDVDPGWSEWRVQVTPPWPYRLPRRGGLDGLNVVRAGVLARLLHDPGGEPVLVRVAQCSGGDLLFGARARYEHVARWAIARLRRVLGVDLELREFHDRHRADPLIGAAVRANPTLRVAGRASAFEALACAITEQLIESERAGAIQRRIIRCCGLRDHHSGLWDFPAAGELAALAPAQLAAMDLSERRSLTLRRAARVVAAGRIDLAAEDQRRQEDGWRALRTIPGIGAWTVEMLAVAGQGRLDQLPAGDLGFLKLVGRLRSGGDPQAIGTEQQVRELFEPYGRWRALAGAYAMRAAGGSGKSALLSRG